MHISTSISQCNSRYMFDNMLQNICLTLCLLIYLTYLLFCKHTRLVRNVACVLDIIYVWMSTITIKIGFTISFRIYANNFIGRGVIYSILNQNPQPANHLGYGGIRR